jgi:hypothetical protein
MGVLKPEELFPCALCFAALKPHSFTGRALPSLVILPAEAPRFPPQLKSLTYASLMACPFMVFDIRKGGFRRPFLFSLVSISILSSWVYSLRQVLKIIISISMS